MVARVHLEPRYGSKQISLHDQLCQIAEDDQREDRLRKSGFPILGRLGGDF